MLVSTCIASGIVLLHAAVWLISAGERMEPPLGKSYPTDILRRLADPLKGQKTNIYRTIKQSQQDGRQEE